MNLLLGQARFDDRAEDVEQKFVRLLNAGG